MEDMINEFLALGARIRDSGMDSKWLVIMAVLFAVSLFVSLREAIQWYFGIHRIRKDLEKLHEALESLKNQRSTAILSDRVHELNFVESAEREKISTTKPEPKAQSFPLQR
jgi:hypothetical protein